jgi:hypothetical protein
VSPEGKPISGSKLENATVLGRAVTARKTGLVPITGTQSKILVPKHIRIVPQFAAENRLQSSLDIDSEIPVMCAPIRTKGIY